jgi:Bifunctional DNA primase/polymerase, N-terminal
MAWEPGDGERLRQALAYAARGIPVLPLHHPVVRRARGATATTTCSCGNLACRAVGKHPATARGVEDATTEPAQLAWWWRRYPEANVGLATGWVFDVLDVDGPESGDSRRWSAVSQLLGLRGPLVRTGGDGWHFYLAPTGLRDPRVHGLAKVEWRGRGGWVAAPPSRHGSGAVYAWVRDLAAPLPAAPPSLRSRLRSGPPALRAGLDGGASGAGHPEVPEGRYHLPLAWDEVAAIQADGEESGQPVRDHVTGDPGGRAIFERWLLEVARARRGERGHTLYRAGLRLFSLAAGGALNRGEVEAGLLAAAETAGLMTEEPSQTRRTLALADRVGSACPAHLPTVDGVQAVPVPPMARPDRGA